MGARSIESECVAVSWDFRFVFKGISACFVGVVSLCVSMSLLVLVCSVVSALPPGIAARSVSDNAGFVNAFLGFWGCFKGVFMCFEHGFSL